MNNAYQQLAILLLFAPLHGAFTSSLHFCSFHQSIYSNDTQRFIGKKTAPRRALAGPPPRRILLQAFVKADSIYYVPWIGNGKSHCTNSSEPSVLEYLARGRCDLFDRWPCRHSTYGHVLAMFVMFSARSNILEGLQVLTSVATSSSNLVVQQVWPYAQLSGRVKVVYRTAWSFVFFVGV